MMKELIKKAISVDAKLNKFLEDEFKPWLEENTTLEEDGRERLSFYLGALLAGFLAAKNKDDVDMMAHRLLSNEMLSVILMSLELSAKLAEGLGDVLKGFDGDPDKCDDCSGE